MTILSNGFEGLSGTLTTANSDDAGGCPLTVIGSPTVDSTYAAHGTKSLKIAAGVAAATRVDVTVSATAVAMRLYVRVPTAITADWYLMAVSVGGSKVITVAINSANKIRLFTGGSTTAPGVWTAPAALSTTGWTRVELFISGISTTTGTVKVATYAGDSMTVIDSYDGTGVSNTGTASFTAISFGRHQSSAGSQDVWIDDVAYEVGATGFIGPVGANVPPVAVAPADVTNAVIGTPVTLTGADSDTDGTISTREWTCVGYPAGSTAPTLSNSATAAVTFTPSAVGIYTMSYRVRDSAGDWSAPDTCLVYVPTTAIRAMYVTSNPGSWDVSGAATVQEAVSDSSDSSLVQSDSTTVNPSKIRIRLFPMWTPTSFPLSIRHDLTLAGSGTLTVRLIEGSTIHESWTITPTTSKTTTPLPLDPAKRAAVGSWLNIDLELEWSV